MRIRFHTAAAALAATIFAACADDAREESFVARVGPYTLTVDEVAELLVDEERVPAQRTVIEQIAELWTDYVVLAGAVAADSTLSDLDFERVVLQQLEPEMMRKLRDSTIVVDSVIPEDELRELYLAEGGSTRMRARHILLPYPVQVTDAAVDGLFTRANELRARAVNGESFEELARRYSGDPGTAGQGGDLGVFGPGDMIPEFEAAAMALEVGEISDPVQSQFGVHLIKLEERRLLDFREVEDDFRARVIAQRFLAAESTFVADVEVGTEPVAMEDAAAVVREIAENPAGRLGGRAANRPLYEYQGGEVTVREVRTVLQSQGPAFRVQVLEGEDEQIDRFLRSLVQRELLVARARAAGFGPSEARMDSLQTEARDQLLGAVRALELDRLDRAPGEALAPAVERAALQAVARVLTGTADMVQLGVIGFQLRGNEAMSISDAAVGQAVLRIGQLRANRSPSLLESAPDSASGNP